MSELEDALEELKSDDKIVRHYAVTTLGEIGGAQAIEVLVGLLKDESPTIKDEAVNSLISIGGKEVAQAVVPLLYDDEVYVSNISVEILGRLGEVSLPSVIALMDEQDDDVLKFAIDVIGLVDSKEPIPLILRHLKHNNPNLRSATAVTLGKLQATDAIDNLVVLLSDDDEWVRFSALEAIGSIGGDDVADKLLDVFKAVDISRIAALDALSMLVDPGDCEKVMQVLSAPGVANVLSVDTIVRFIQNFDGHMSDHDKNIFLHILLPRLKEGTVEEQCEALKGLTRLKDKSSIDAILLYAGTQDYDEETRSLLKDAIVSNVDLDKITVALSVYPKHCLVMVEALGDIADPTTVESIVALLKTNPDKKVKRSIIETLGNIANPDTFDIIKDATGDEESNVRKNAIVALGKLADKRAVPVLLDLLIKEEYDDIKETIGLTLSEFDGEEVEGAYLSLLDSEDLATRIVAIVGLATVKSDNSRKKLLEILGDEDARIRCECIRALGAQDGDDIAVILTGALSDKDKQVRMTAIEALGDRGEMSLIADALDDEDMWVRFKVANLLADSAVPQSENKLIELLNTDQIPVKVACARALGTLKSKNAIESLKAFAKDEDVNLKSAAEEALKKCEE